MAQYSKPQYLNVIGLPRLVKYDFRKEIVCSIFHGINVEIGQRDIQTSHRIKDNWTTAKFSSMKDDLQVLRVKKQLKLVGDISRVLLINSKRLEVEG